MKLDQLNDPIVHSDGWIVDPTLTGNLGSSQMRNVQRSSRIGVLKCRCIASDVGSIDVGTASRCLNHMAVIYPRHTHQATGPLPQPRAKTNVGDNLITSTTRTSSTVALLHRRTLLQTPLFQHPRDITTAIRVQHRLGEPENSYALTSAPVGRSVADTMWEASSQPDQFSRRRLSFSYHRYKVNVPPSRQGNSTCSRLPAFRRRIADGAEGRYSRNPFRRRQHSNK